MTGCGDCYLFDSYDGGGPHYCRAFQVKFRGYTEPERGHENPLVPGVWTQAIGAALQTSLIYGRGETCGGEEPTAPSP